MTTELLQGNPPISGIYIIKSPSGHVYYGSTKNLKRRWYEHVRDLSKNRHANLHMQRRYNINPDNWLVYIVEEIVCNDELLKTREQEYLDLHYGKQYCMNTNPIADRPPHTLKSRQKQSNTMKGRIPWNKGVAMSAAHKNNLSKARKGFKASAETKAKLSAMRQNRPPEYRAKMSKAIKAVWASRKLLTPSVILLKQYYKPLLQ